MEMLYKKETERSVQEVEIRLRAAAEKHQFGIISVVDLRGKMLAKGIEFNSACLVYEVCNPHRANEVLQSRMEVSTALPCRISIYEEAGRTQVATLLPKGLIGMFGVAELDSVAESVENDLVAMIDETVAD